MGLLQVSSLVPKGLAQSSCPVSSCPDVYTEEVFLGGRGEGEGMPLQLGDGWALDEDVLPRGHSEVTLLHVNFQDSRWVTDHLNQNKRNVFHVGPSNTLKIASWLS